FRLSNLLRFFRLLGHRDWRGAGFGIQTDGEFQDTVLFEIYFRILASMAHLAVIVVSGLHVHSFGSHVDFAIWLVLYDSGHVQCQWTLARGQLDLRGLGSFKWCLSASGRDDRTIPEYGVCVVRNEGDRRFESIHT